MKERIIFPKDLAELGRKGYDFHSNLEDGTLLFYNKDKRYYAVYNEKLDRVIMVYEK